MGKFNTPREGKQLRVPPAAKEEKPTIGAKKAAAASPAALAKNRKIILISVCSVTVALLIGIVITIWYFFGWPTNDGLILNNVMVAGINLGGMTAEEAKKTLHDATDYTYTQTDMVIVLPDTTMHLVPAKTGARLDVDAVVDEAHAYGRRGTYQERKAAKEASLVSTYHVPVLNHLNLDLQFLHLSF